MLVQYTGLLNRPQRVICKKALLASIDANNANGRAGMLALAFVSAICWSCIVKRVQDFLIVF